MLYEVITPLDKRTPSFADNGINADMHIEYVWDINFWTAWLDDIARYRYNFISLWSRHPFPNLVKLKNFPDRITSYNVCYTKLLRKLPMAALQR